MYKEMHGVFEVIEDAIDAAYEAQRILEANYTPEQAVSSMEERVAK